MLQIITKYCKVTNDFISMITSIYQDLYIIYYTYIYIIYTQYVVKLHS